jgi:hypothetical protein
VERSCPWITNTCQVSIPHPRVVSSRDAFIKARGVGWFLRSFGRGICRVTTGMPHPIRPPTVPRERELHVYLRSEPLSVATKYMYIPPHVMILSLSKCYTFNDTNAFIVPYSARRGSRLDHGGYSVRSMVGRRKVKEVNLGRILREAKNNACGKRPVNKSATLL